MFYLTAFWTVARSVEQVLIKWEGLPIEEATWMDIAELRRQFPYFRLEDKAVLAGRAVDTKWREESRNLWLGGVAN